MKRLVILAVALLLTGAAHAQSTEVAQLITREEVVNDTCRGGSGDEPATVKACEIRDSLFKQIEAHGWCWGHEGQAEYEKDWEPCSATTRSEEVNQLIAREYAAGDMCAGGSGPEVACEIQNDLFIQIQAHGWCWGHKGDWEPCSVKPQ
jgi:hypothetical protein